MTTTPLTFAQALQQVSDIAHAKLPETLRSRLEMATALVSNGAVWSEDDGHTYAVRSTEDPAKWWSVNGLCLCPDAAFRAPESLCKHRPAVGLWRRTSELLREPASPSSAVVEATSVDVSPHGIPASYIVTIQGKPYVKVAGLLWLAHKRGLQALKVDWTYNDADLSLAHAVAVFPFGTFEESGDATRDNVTKKVAPHFRRCALTRAAARALRLALGVGLVAAEEMGEE